MTKNKSQKYLLYAIAILIAFMYLIPFYIIARNALMTKVEVSSFDWIVWPEQAQWENVVNLFNDPLAPMATYGLARIKYRWADQVFYLILIALMVPPAAIFVQMFLVVDRLGWVSSYPGLIVPGIFNVFSVFIFRQFFLDFPRELEEAGKVDGLGYFGIFWRIVLPNSTGVFIALGTISLIKSWNAFLWPLVVGQSKDTWTVQVVLSTFLTAQTINLPALFMGAAIGILPMILIFFVVQRYLVQGVSTTGLKG